MLRFGALLILLLFCNTTFSQGSVDVVNPADFRQHNLTRYNASLLNPVFSFVRNENPKLATWGRIQWSELDRSPTTYFTNYSGRLGEKNGVGLGVFQHDVGIFTNIGVIANYARGFRIGDESWITLGINVIGSKRTIDRDDFTADEFNMLPMAGRNDISLIAMPGISLTLGKFTIGVSSENLIDYNLTQSELETEADKIIFGHASYDFKFNTGRGTFLHNGLLRTTVYGKTIPNEDAQFGGNLMLDLNSGWIQAGYNSFFGPSVGLGAKLFKTLAVGGLIELGNSDNSEGLGPTYEFVAAIEFGRSRDRNGFAGPKKKKKKKKAAPPKEEKKEININEINIELFPIKQARDTVYIRDTVYLKENEKKLLKKFYGPGEENDRYMVVEGIDGVDYGFYLVVNVYATMKYFRLFMKHLNERGLAPKYFYNNKNKYRYVYLKKYDTLEEIEAARESNYNGRYDGETWILWVRE
ncbi:type IX secretion system membrane protein PorP/SprF [Leptobacterium flavescens]|uniref:Type IX secretion system membrane protein PorP/SprF n=1 Tax=Leptobacterium flavescens TaxID=472055 RepID=A0A6P0USJ9_9FLAO|nr:PorP/SprF family type IX secretion system membrane protein [Leptobacterium flavescens]NER13336.1 type IX secretion system membrane protein PorP/SprF [Leptobacterium flavescens]